MNQEIAIDIVKYVVDKANVSLENAETGFLTGQHINSLPKEDVEYYLETVQSMLIPYIKNHTYGIDEKLTSDDCVRMFQYIFDRSFEISYKVITREKAYTVFDATETGDYYELDVPEYIQLKVNQIVPKTVLTFVKTYNYICEKGYNSEDYMKWLHPLLFGASCIALSFAMQIDLDDDTEMQQYLADD